MNKRDLFRLSSEAAQAGRAQWTGPAALKRDGDGWISGLAPSTMNAEEMAPKTWIRWIDKGSAEVDIECELYAVPRATNSKEAVGLLVGMCPKCAEHFSVREDNKQMSVEYMAFNKCPKHIRQNWARHCKLMFGRGPSNEDKIPVVSSSERWACDYCRGWCVRVTNGVASTDMTGVTQVIVSSRIPIIEKERKTEKVEL